MHRLWHGLIIASSLFITACVSPIPIEKQIADTDYKPAEHILVSVLDNRVRVRESQENKEKSSESDYDEIMSEVPVRDYNFVGVAHGVYGIPVDWTIRDIATIKADRNKTLARFLRDRIVKGLKKHGWSVAPVDMSRPDEEEARRLMKEHNADKLIALNIKEWYFSINLNWVTAFNLDTNTDIHVYDYRSGEILNKNIHERDVIDEKYDDAPRNMILQAYKNQLDQIFNDPELKSVLGANQ